MKKIAYIIGFILASFFVCAQPYTITAYIDSNVIRHNDVSSLQSITYAGQGMNWVFDRRVDDWVLIDAYLFDVVYDDLITSQVQVNPEFGSIAAATSEAQKYAFIIGQLPACLRTGVDEIWIHQGTESFGGGFNAVLIHTGQSASYEPLGILEEVLFHEATHSALDPTHATSTGWTNAQNTDVGFISTYGASSPIIEDLAESFLSWLMVRQCNRRVSINDSLTISQTIVNRIAYFDSLNLNMYPLCIAMNVTGMNKFGIKNFDISLYPNPSIGKFTFSNIERGNRIEVFDLFGKLIFETIATDTFMLIDLEEKEKGIYMYRVMNAEGKTKQGKLIVK